MSLAKSIKLTSFKNAYRISSASIASNIGVSHKSVKNLLRKHKKRLESFGELPFKKALKGREKHVYLNENQACFLLTLSRNTDIVVGFKHALVKEFSRLKKEESRQAERRASIEWQQNRELGILTRKDLTDTIKLFVEYAKSQGSSGCNHYYTLVSKAIAKALGTEKRNLESEQNLHILATCESIAARYLMTGMNDQLPYKTIYRGLIVDLNRFADMVFGIEHT